MMIVAGLSRWTLAHFYAALASFLLAQVLLAAGIAGIDEPLQAWPILATVHLLTIGWLSTLMFGALYQFVPVITGATLPGRHAPLLTLIATQLGLAGMVAGFLGPWYGLDHARLCLPAGGSLVAAGLGGGALYLLWSLWRARPLPLAARFVAAGQGFLLLTLTLGLCFSVALTFADAPAWLVEMLGRGLPVHVLVGLGGWFTLTAMGVAYRLLSMFMLAPENETPTGRWAFRLAALGLLALFAAGLAAPENESGTALAVAAAPAASGLVLYLIDMVHLVHGRQRRALELNSRAAIGALAALAATLALIAAALAAGTLEEAAAAIGYLVLFGWLSGLGLSQLYKIVPFLTWLERYGPRLGKGRVPRVQDLVNEPRATPWFALYGMAVAVGTFAALLGASELWRFAVAAHLLATIGISVELWRARHGAPAEPTAPTTLPFPTVKASGGLP